MAPWLYQKVKVSNNEILAHESFGYVKREGTIFRLSPLPSIKGESFLSKWGEVDPEYLSFLLSFDKK